MESGLGHAQGQLTVVCDGCGATGVRRFREEPEQYLHAGAMISDGVTASRGAVMLIVDLPHRWDVEQWDGPKVLCPECRGQFRWVSKCGKEVWSPDPPPEWYPSDDGYICAEHRTGHEEL